MHYNVEVLKMQNFTLGGDVVIFQNYKMSNVKKAASKRFCFKFYQILISLTIWINYQSEIIDGYRNQNWWFQWAIT